MPRSLVRAALEAAVDIGVLQVALQWSPFLWEPRRLRRRRRRYVLSGGLVRKVPNAVVAVSVGRPCEQREHSHSGE
jgi:hypothetical protein